MRIRHYQSVTRLTMPQRAWSELDGDNDLLDAAFAACPDPTLNLLLAFSEAAETYDESLAFLALTHDYIVLGYGERLGPEAPPSTLRQMMKSLERRVQPPYLIVFDDPPFETWKEFGFSVVPPLAGLVFPRPVYARGIDVAGVHRIITTRGLRLELPEHRRRPEKSEA